MLAHSPSIVMNGLVLALDAGNIKSYNAGISTTTWTDVSGRGNTGTLAGGPTYNSSNGGVLEFTGTQNATLSSNNIVGLAELTTDFSISVWVKYNSTVAYTAFFEKQNTVAGGTGVRLDLGWITGLIYLTTYNESTQAINNATIAYTNDTNLWYNITLCCQGSTKTGYVNGVLALTQSFTSNFPANTHALGIGGRIRKLNGNISNTLIYNRALTAAEVAQNFNALRGRYGI
jgi:hypothetical protein